MTAVNWNAASAVIRDGIWMTAERIRVYPWIFVGVWVAGLLGLLFSPTGVTWGGADFVVYWIPAHLAAAGHQAAIYNPRLLAGLEQAASGQPGIYLPFPYPPTFLLLILPLGIMPFGVAFITLEVTSVLAYSALVWKLLGARGLPLAFAFPALAICVYNGHFEILLAVCFGLAVILLDSAPYAAGALIAVCSVKPHLFLMVPVALIAGRHWKALWSAVLSTIVGGLTATVVFGADIWADFLHSMGSLGKGLAVHQNAATYNVLAKQQSVFAFGSRFLTSDLAALLQIVTILIAAGVVYVVWKANGTLERRALSLCACTLLATPYLFDYDLVLFAIPIALSARDGLENGFPPWRKSLLGALWLTPALARISSFYCDSPLTAALLCCAAAIVMRESQARLRAGVQPGSTKPS